MTDDDEPIAAQTQARLVQIAERDPALKSFIRVDREQALAAARASDVRHRSGAPLGPLDGLPVAVKDNLAIAGTSWTAGVAGRRALLAEADANAVTRLRAAGAVLLGGLNMEEAALGAVTDNPTFGRCINPLRAGYTPGGSSGGSAAAVAAGLVDLALGTDTLGSVRIPASYCGVYGMKPTFGLVGRTGLALLSPMLDTIGVLCRDPALLWPAIEVLAGVDPDDPESRPVPQDWSARPDVQDLGGLRFGLPRQINMVESDDAVLAGLVRAREAIGALGGEVVELDLAGWVPAVTRRAGFLVIEAEGAVELADLMEVDSALSPGLLRLLAYGRDLPAARLVSASARLRAAGAAAERALANVDALILPTTPQRAFRHGTPAPVNQADLTGLANCAGCPAIALPVVLDAEDLPASIQIVGPAWSEARLTRWAEILAPVLRANS